MKNLTARIDFPTSYVIFGATGDLARTKLLPALVRLHEKNLLPEQFSIVAFSRRPFSHEEFRNLAKEAFQKSGIEPSLEFLRTIYYVQGTFDAPDGYRELAKVLGRLDKEVGHCSNKLFHLAVPPSFYETIFKNLSESGLTIPCGGNEGWTRVLVEKPFGRDANNAQVLDRELGRLFQEEQIFRIDHYLAKETIQNILVFRFTNPIFRPLWDGKHIESVRVTLFEADGVGTRGALYDGLGALRDVGQNHVLQMLALVLMDKPDSWRADSIRAARAKILRALTLAKSRGPHALPIRAQYLGFREETGVAANSETETYFKIGAKLKSGRFKGVPLTLEAGKALAENRVEIEVVFKSTTSANIGEGKPRNSVIFRIQPNEAIGIRFFVKQPGFDMNVDPQELSFAYAPAPSAYERVLMDAIRGDQTLFSSTAEVLASWKFITLALKQFEKVPLGMYSRGSLPEGS